MGKGSYDGIKMDALSYEVFKLEEQRQCRIDKLRALGYEVARVDGFWCYRVADSGNHWTPMD